MVLLLWRLYPSISVSDQASARGVSRKTPVHRNPGEANKSLLFARAAAQGADFFSDSNFLNSIRDGSC